MRLLSKLAHAPSSKTLPLHPHHSFHSFPFQAQTHQTLQHNHHQFTMLITESHKDVPTKAGGDMSE
jgi:hypothetical protein